MEPKYHRIQPKIKPIPVELIANIIRIVADGNSQSNRPHFWTFSTLAAGSLVSRTWNSICRSHIFRTVTIVELEDPVTPLSFLHFKAPHLCGYIRQLHLEWHDRCPSVDWLSECFKRFKNLQYLHLDTWQLFRPPVPYLASLLAAPRLRKLILFGWHFGASSLLDMLPVTIEELIFEEIGSEKVPDALAPPALSNTGVCLESLRSMVISCLYHPMPKFKTLIECPNLRRLCVQCSESQPWDLPPWVPASLSELELRVQAGSRIPDFGAAIRPSVVTIHLSAVSYLQPSTWIKDCINSFPFPRSIQVLTINILNQHSIADDGTDGLYPELSDYEILSSVLQQLRVGGHGNLEKIILGVTMEVECAYDDELRADEGRELAKLKKAFAELLEALVLDVDFTLKRTDVIDECGTTHVGETLLHSSIHTL